MTIVTTLTMLRLTGKKRRGDSQNLFEVFAGINEEFGAHLKRFTESGKHFEVFYLMPNTEMKKRLKKHIKRMYCVVEKPVLTLKIATSEDIKTIIEEVEKKAKKMRGKVVSAGYNDQEGVIVLTFERKQKCRLFKIWAVREIR